MAAMLAACSQDELVSVAEDAKVDLGNRPVIGNVTLGLGDMQTRMGIQEGSSLKLAWVNGDKIGAAIVDSPAESAVSGKGAAESSDGEDYSTLTWTYDQYIANVKKNKNDNSVTEAEDGVTYAQAGLTAKDFYAKKDYISSNYPYEYQNGSFNTQANLVEGNYVFYAPYNPANLMRKPIKVVLPREQDCSGTEMIKTEYMGKEAYVSSTALKQFYGGAIKDFENAPVVIGYKFLAAPEDGSLIRPVVDMNQLYAFPMITVKNNFSTRLYAADNNGNSEAVGDAGVTMTIDSIQIYDDAVEANNHIFYTAPTKASQIANKLAKDGEWTGKRFTEGAPTADLLDASGMKKDYYKHSDTREVKMAAVNTVLTNKPYRVTCKLGKELEKGGEYHFHAILPAANYEKNLKARVFATINGKPYVIVEATIDKTGSTPTYATSGWKDFVFQDVDNGGQDCELIRGEHYPKAEWQLNGEGKKDFAGNMLTLNLDEKTAAFELDDNATAPTVDNGLKDNTALIEYLQSSLQRGVNVTECPSLRGVAKNEWKTSTAGSITAAPGNLAFKADNEIIINASLVGDLAEQIYASAAPHTEVFTLVTNLPSAKDVKMTKTKDTGVTKYTYTTFGENGVSFTFTMADADVTSFNTDATKLTGGINNIGSSAQSAAVNATLALAGNATDAVVYLEGVSGKETTVTVNNGGAGISAIYVNANTKLIVKDKACDALIIANGGEIEIGNGGSLTNENNEFEGGVVITNNVARTIKGHLGDGVEVSATYNSSWPTDKIAAASQINKVNINLSNENDNLSIEQAQIDIFENLTAGVALTLEGNIKGIKSNSNVVLTNIKKLTGTQLTGSVNIKWKTDDNAGVTITEEEADVIENIEAGVNVTFEVAE